MSDVNYICPICKTQFHSDSHKRVYCDDCLNLPDGTAVVYGLHDGDGVIKYIGSTTAPAQRFMLHRINNKSSEQLREWIHHCSVLQMEIIERTKAETMRRREQYFIRKMRRDGFDLLNINRAARPTHDEAQEMLRRYMREFPSDF